MRHVTSLTKRRGEGEKTFTVGKKKKRQCPRICATVFDGIVDTFAFSSF